MLEERVCKRQEIAVTFAIALVSRVPDDRLVL